MNKKHFLFKLIAPRPSFNLDMSEAEKATMQVHVGYWTELIAKRTAIVFGPVFDPKGVYGMAVIEVDAEEEAAAIASNDPAVHSKICSYELIPMMVGMVRQ
jgi:uncharacterized protein YciI